MRWGGAWCCIEVVGLRALWLTTLQLALRFCVFVIVASAAPVGFRSGLLSRSAGGPASQASRSTVGCRESGAGGLESAFLLR